MGRGCPQPLVTLDYRTFSTPWGSPAEAEDSRKYGPGGIHAHQSGHIKLLSARGLRSLGVDRLTFAKAQKKDHK